MADKYSYLKKNTAFFAISTFGTKILSFFLIPLYTSALTTSEYGIADIISTTATLLIYVLTIDIAEAVLRFSVESDRSYAQNIFSFGNRIIIISTVVCAAILCCMYVFRIFDWPLYYYFYVLACYFSSSYHQLMSAYLRGIDKVRESAFSGLLAGMVTSVSNIVLLLVFRTGFNGYLFSMVAGSMVAAIYCIIKSDLGIKSYFFDNSSETLRKKMLRYSSPLVFNNMALWINGYLDRYFVTFICGSAANGIYSVSSKIPNLLAVCYTVFGNAWNLSAIKEFDAQDKDDFFGRIYRLFNAFMTIACSMLILLNIPLAGFLYEKEFFSAWKCSSVLLISVMFNSLTMFLGGILSAVNNTTTIAMTTILGALCNVVMNAVMIPFIGPMGAAIATAATYGIMWIARMKSARKYIRFKVNILSDIAVYGIICLQVVFENLSGHLYAGQIICLIAIMLIYHKQMTVFMGKLIKILDKLCMKAGKVLFSSRPLRDAIVLESHNDFDSNGGALYDWLITNGLNKKYKIIWLLWNKNPGKLPDNVTACRLTMPGLRKAYYLYTSKYLLSSHAVIGSYRDDQVSVYMDHGAMSLKSVKGVYFIPHNLNYILMPSEDMAPILINDYNVDTSFTRPIITGYPYQDILYSDEPGDLKKITTESYNKVIIWMPTFRKNKNGVRNDSSKDEKMGIPVIDNYDQYERLNEYLNDNNVLMIIKIHPMQDLSVVRIQTLSNIIVLDGKSVKQYGVDNYRLMKDTDALITDYSSVACDYLHLDRPIGYTLDDEADYRLGFLVNPPEKLMAGEKIYNYDQLIDFISGIVASKDLYKTARHELFDKCFKYHDGKSCERLADFLHLD